MIRTSSLIVTSLTTEPCGDCIEVCQKCLNKNSLDLHHEIEELKAKLTDSNNRMIQMQLDFGDGQRSLEMENIRIQDELNKLRDRCDRLMDSHKKLQRLNHNLECKLLTVVEKLEEEKRSLSEESLRLNLHLLESKVAICDLKEELDRYRQDCNVAVQLLQCKPSNFIPHKLTSLPPELQLRVKSHLGQKQMLDLNESSQLCHQRQHEPPSKIIRVPMATFPPTAIVYSVNRASNGLDSANDSDVVIPAAVMARVLTKPDNAPCRSGRVVVCRKCLAENLVTDSWTQTKSWLSAEMSSFSGSAKDGNSSIEHSPLCQIQSREEPHPKVHRHRYNSVESQN